MRRALIGSSLAAIKRLFSSCRPSAIAWFIVAVVVRVSVYRVPGRWSRPDISKKCLERFIPLRVHFYTPAAIFSVCSIVRVLTAIFEMIPSPVLGRVTRTVCAEVFQKQFRSKAPTGCAGSSGEVVLRDPLYGATITKTSEVPVTTTAFTLCDHQPASKTSPDKFKFARYGRRLWFCLRSLQIATQTSTRSSLSRDQVEMKNVFGYPAIAFAKMLLGSLGDGHGEYPPPPVSFTSDYALCHG